MELFDPTAVDPLDIALRAAVEDDERRAELADISGVTEEEFAIEKHFLAVVFLTMLTLAVFVVARFWECSP